MNRVMFRNVAATLMQLSHVFQVSKPKIEKIRGAKRYAPTLRIQTLIALDRAVHHIL
jgi:hypothetical protein